MQTDTIQYTATYVFAISFCICFCFRNITSPTFIVTKLSFCSKRILTFSPVNRLSSVNFLLCFKFHIVLQCRSKLVKMLSDYQTVLIRLRRRVTRRLVQIQLFANGTLVVICELRVQCAQNDVLCNILVESLSFQTQLHVVCRRSSTFQPEKLFQHGYSYFHVNEVSSMQ